MRHGQSNKKKSKTNHKALTSKCQMKKKHQFLRRILKNTELKPSSSSKLVDQVMRVRLLCKR